MSPVLFSPKLDFNRCAMPMYIHLCSDILMGLVIPTRSVPPMSYGICSRHEIGLITTSTITMSALATLSDRASSALSPFTAPIDLAVAERGRTVDATPALPAIQVRHG